MAPSPAAGTGRCSASRSRSRTASTSPVGRRPWPVPATPTRATRTPHRSCNGCSTPVRSWSARPTSTSSPPASTAPVRRTRIPRSVFGQDLISGGSSSGSALVGGARRGPVRRGHRHRRVRAGAARAQRRLRLQAVPRPDQRGRAGAGLPLAGLRQPDRAAPWPTCAYVFDARRGAGRGGPVESCPRRTGQSTAADGPDRVAGVRRSWSSSVTSRWPWPMRRPAVADRSGLPGRHARLRAVHSMPASCSTPARGGRAARRVR